MAQTPRPKALFILHDAVRERIFPPDIYDDIASRVDIYAPPQSPTMVEANPAILRDMELLFSSWTCPHIDEAFLEHAPNLKAVFYGAGTIKHVVSPAFWERGLRITHAADANAITVAQYTVGQILLSLKGMWPYMQQVNSARTFANQPRYAGLHQSTTGIIGLGMIGRHVCEYLRPFDVNILAHDPYASDEMAHNLNVTLVSLDELFTQANVVSLHAPWLPETEGMITREHFASMQPHSTFINTARGALVHEDDMLRVLQERTDIFALLDVTYPEPPPSDSALYDLPNIILTPHIAGAVDAADTRRMGVLIRDELERYLQDGSLKWEVMQKHLTTMA